MKDESWTDELWDRLEEKYDLQGYTDSLIIIKYQKLINLDKKLEDVKKDLIEWSRHHDPPKKEDQIHLWCSINRLIGDHFGSDWMD